MFEPSLLLFGVLSDLSSPKTDIFGNFKLNKFLLFSESNSFFKLIIF